MFPISMASEPVLALQLALHFNNAEGSAKIIPPPSFFWRGYFVRHVVFWGYIPSLFLSMALCSSNPGLPSSANMFFLYASTPGWSNGLTSRT